MRLSAFLEAWVQLVLQEGNRVVPKAETEVPQQGVTELKSHHKVVAVRPQPGAADGLKRLIVARPMQGRSLEVKAHLC